MKPIKIDITSEILDKYTTDSSSVTGIQIKSIDTMSCTIPNHLVGFPQIAVKMLELFAIGKANCDFRKVKTGSEVFGFANIKSNADNNAIFEIFRKFGIVAGNLTIGFAGTKTEPVVYTTAKLMKDISKFAPEVQAALCFTLYNIIGLCSKVIIKEPEIIYKSISSTVAVDTELDTFVASFTGIKNITIAELPTEDYKEIQYFKNRYNDINSIYSGNLTYAAVAPQRDDGTLEFNEVNLLTAVSFSTVTYPILITKTGLIKTTMELTNFESAKDSYFTHLAVPYGLPTVIVRNVSLENILADIPKNAVVVDLLNDEDLENNICTESAPSIATWIGNAKSFKRDNLSEKEFVTLNKMLGIKTISTGALDKTAMMELYKDDEYAQQLYKQNKAYYDTFELGNLNANLRGFAKGDLYSMLFAGDSGTGKSTAARVMPSRCGIPYISINFSVNIEESDIFGSMIPNTTKTTADDPEFVWQDGVLTKAIRNGYCAVLEEINFARPGVLGKLNSLLDENRQIDLPTGEVLKAHPNFRIIATCNVAYEGTNRFNKALVNRFDDCTIFRDVSRAKAIEIIKNRTGYKNMTKIDVIYNVYEALKKYGKEQNLNLIVSMRQLLNLFSNGKYYTDAKDAVVRIMLNGAFIEEPEYQEEFEKAVLPAFKLNFKI